MIQLLAGVGVMLVTCTVFWRMLPRDGQRHRWVDTEWEPYIGVAFTSSVALGLTLMLSAVLDLLST